MKPFRILSLLGILVILNACVSSPAPNNNQNPNDPTQPTTPSDDGACTYVLTKDITVPSRLVNTPAVCDYVLEGFVRIKSSLTIEPGVVIRAKQNATVRVDGGQITAVGTADARIVMEGLNHLAGYWRGIRVAEGRESKFEYFDLKDAGQVCSSLWCPDAALLLDDITVSFANSTVSNSYVHGLQISSDVLLTKFENNRFYNNTWAGLVVNAKHIPTLDTASDYAGQGANNGRPYVLVSSSDQKQGQEYRWKNLNAPYLLGSVYLDYGTVILEPGVEMVMASEGGLILEYAELKAIGTPDAPIIFRGLKPDAGYWEAIEFRDSEGVFEHVQVSDGGLESLVSNSMIDVGESTFTISNSRVSNSINYGIYCSGYSRDPSNLTIGENVVFDKIARSNLNIQDDCNLNETN